MKRFLLLPSCALLALGVLTSCQKEDKTAAQLADELTAELQNVTDYKTAEAAAPRVEALNKRFQNAGVRVFSVGGNALIKSGNGYADSVVNLAKEIGRVRASKPVKEADGDIDESRLIRTVGVGSGSSATAPAKEQLAKGQTYIYNDSSDNNNNPPTFAECYGSSKLAAALDYVANPSDFGMMHMDSEADVPAIPAAVEVAEEEEPSADAPVAADDDSAASADADTTPAPAADDEDDTTPAPAPAADDDDDDDGLNPDADDDDSSSSASTSSSSSDDDDSSSSSDDDDDALISIDDDL